MTNDRKQFYPSCHWLSGYNWQLGSILISQPRQLIFQTSQKTYCTARHTELTEYFSRTTCRSQQLHLILIIALGGMSHNCYDLWGSYLIRNQKTYIFHVWKITSNEWKIRPIIDEKMLYTVYIIATENKAPYNLK